MSPTVTVAIPALNEEAAIGECLDRVRAQTWGDLDIVVADGGSTDRTRDIVREHAAVDPRVRLVDNPRRLQSAGLNEVVAATTGDVVVRLDARSFVDQHYVRQTVDLLEATGAAVVGGRMVPRPSGGLVARGIALANIAPWGAGPARFHRAGEAGPADTVYLGVFQRVWLERAGGWAEDVGVNEDYELNHRIRSLGGVVWLDPSLEVGYQPRTSFRALAKQYFRYGRSKATVMRRHPRSVRARQVAPLCLLPLALAAMLPHWVGLPARIGLLAYPIMVLGCAIAARGSSVADRMSAAVAAMIMHWTWAVGAGVGFVRPFASAAGEAP